MKNICLFCVYYEIDGRKPTASPALILLEGMMTVR